MTVRLIHPNGTRSDVEVHALGKWVEVPHVGHEYGRFWTVFYELLSEDNGVPCYECIGGSAS